MSKDELLDLVNENNEVIGTVWRSETDSNPNLIHREVDIFIFNSKGQSLIQQRALTKKKNPGLWINSAAGHIDAGELPENAAIREAKEELGIDINPILFKIYLDKSDGESRFFYVYYAIFDGEPQIDRNEVEDFRWSSIKEIENNPTLKFDKASLELLSEVYTNVISSRL